ncbi:type 1 fimbrial major subunit FimA [Klebsiella oxytoca]|uniref:Fimbrial protein n=1 Tax=Klebsiella oxytoca TaxID=571 RepID=A0A6B8MT27_KLEOX|nr:type 1 fimbrial major subunit FimA [Klebsiella oxytoca]QGN39642.1 fimbrial protein [Klebsiella oxytoca]
MKMKTLAIAAMSVLSLSSVAANAATVSVFGGDVHFQGSVTNGACAVSAATSNQIVNLGQVKAANMATKGDTSNSVGFTIDLLDCDITVASTAAFAFSGVADSSDPNLLALQSSTAGGATNVAVQILDGVGKVMGLNAAKYGTPVALVNGTNKIPFQARYYATGAATAGTADADATFNIQYQ